VTNYRTVGSNTSPFGVRLERIFPPPPDPWKSRYKPPEREATIDPNVPRIEVVGSVDSTYSEGQPPVIINFKVEWNEDVSQRESEEERVENPNDPDQFVMVEKINSATFVNSLTGERTKINMDRITLRPNG
jgi:hypothetical protein